MPEEATRTDVSWGRKWGRYAVVLVGVLLTMYAAEAVATVLHELAHAAAFVLMGRGLACVDIPLTLEMGIAAPQRHDPSDSWAAIVPRAAAPASQLLLGLLVLAGIRVSARFRSSLFAICFVLVSVGAFGLEFLNVGLSGESTAWHDLPAIASGFGIPFPVTRWASAVLGPIVMLVVAATCGRMLLRWAGGYLDTTSYRERLQTLVVICWAPIFLVAQILEWLTEAFSVPPPLAWPHEPDLGWAWWPMIIGTLLVTAVIAMPPLSPTPARRPGYPAPRPSGVLSRSVALAAAAFALVLGVRWTLGPVRAPWVRSGLPASEELAAWVAPRAGNVKALLLASHWSFLAGRNAEGLAYMDRAAPLVGDDASVLSRIATTYEACGRESEASKLLARAEAIQPDLPAIHVTWARLHEKRKEYKEAAASWRRVVTLLRASQDPRMRPEEREIDMLLDRASRLEKIAENPPR